MGLVLDSFEDESFTSFSSSSTPMELFVVVVSPSTLYVIRDLNNGSFLVFRLPSEGFQRPLLPFLDKVGWDNEVIPASDTCIRDTVNNLSIKNFLRSGGCVGDVGSILNAASFLSGDGGISIVVVTVVATKRCVLSLVCA